MTFAHRLAHVDNIAQQDSSERAFNKLTRTFTTQMEALKRYRTGAEQKARYNMFGRRRRPGDCRQRHTVTTRKPPKAEAAMGRSRLRHHRAPPTSFRCQTWAKTRNTIHFQCSASQTNERPSQAQHGANAFQSTLWR